MPSTSAKQAKFMAAAAHNPKFAKMAGITTKVAKEFNNADQAKTSQSKSAPKKSGY
jgi:hypothetical protein